MDTNITVLAQLAPAATTETVLYQVLPGNRSFINGVTVCNRSNSNRTFRLSISLLGGATATKDYLYYDLSLTANNTFLCELSVTIGSPGVVRVYASSADLSFTLYGIP